MHKKLRSTCAFALLLIMAAFAFAQRPRTSTSQDSADNSTNIPTPPPAPASVKAKYEGGVFGYNKKLDGTVNFDDQSGRFIFRDGKGKEILFIPYKSLTGAYGDTKRVQPAAATVAGAVPSLYSLPAHFIKTKVRYLTLQYSDPDSSVSGVASFRLDNKDILDSVLFTLAGKAGLDRRGEVFVRKK
ncbi:MAG TPA: hypothetical protein VK557_07510 [Pyrinomonadaceae bacterium]|nr:hypothetical protein [Pyrinomonadaceae bacterium]